MPDLVTLGTKYSAIVYLVVNLAGLALLVSVDWRIAVGVFLVSWAELGRRAQDRGLIR